LIGKQRCLLLKIVIKHRNRQLTGHHWLSASVR
jgi:hypothetical protein